MSINKDILDRLMDGSLSTPVTEATATIYVGICVGKCCFLVSPKTMIRNDYVQNNSPFLLITC